MIAAGKRDKLVIVQRAITAKDEYGEPVPSWGDIGRTRAQMIFGRGDERRAAAMQEGVQPATFLMLVTNVTRSLTLQDRLIAQGTVWNIRSVAIDTPRRGTVEVVAVANRDIEV